MTVKTAGMEIQGIEGAAASVRENRDLARLRDAAKRAAGLVFFEPMLKAMHESKLKGPFGHGGRGEDVFAGQLRAVLAERMGTRGADGLGDVLYRRFERQQRILSRVQVHRSPGIHAGGEA
jgi:hypothetical protein